MDEELEITIYCQIIPVLRKLCNVKAPESSADESPEHDKLDRLADLLTARIAKQLTKEYILIEKEDWEETQKAIEVVYNALTKLRD